MRHHRLFTLASGDPIVRPSNVIECASIKEANTGAEALSITASLRGYFDDLRHPLGPKERSRWSASSSVLKIAKWS